MPAKRSPRKREKIQREPVIRAFATRLKLLRSGRGLSQRELASQAGLHVTYVSRLERGEASPGLDLMDALAKALHAPLSELVGVTESDPLPALQSQVRKRIESILNTADASTLAMLNPWLALLDDAINRKGGRPKTRRNS